MRRLSRKRNQRKALLRGLADSLFLREKIELTEAKAKDLSRYIEKIIRRTKKGDLAARKFLAGLFSKKTAEKVFKEIVPRYKERNGGYIRIIKLGPRKSDGARIAIIELVK